MFVPIENVPISFNDSTSYAGKRGHLIEVRDDINITEHTIARAKTEEGEIVTIRLLALKEAKKIINEL